jgi:hypothetical protein
MGSARDVQSRHPSALLREGQVVPSPTTIKSGGSLRRRLMLAEVQVTAYAEKMRRVLAGKDEFPEYWARLRRRLAPQARAEKPCGAELRRVYEEETGIDLGCD